MAKTLTTSGLKKLKIAKYDDLRPTLRSGDLLFCSGNYLVSRMIRWSTDSVWSHVGIIFRVDSIDRVLLLESVEDVGVRFAPLTKYLQDYEDGQPYDGPLVIARSSAVSPAKAKRAAQFGVDKLTRPYDKEEIGMIVARIALGEGKAKRDDDFICSELVAECLVKAGIPAGELYDKRGFVSPENVWVHGSVELVGRIK